MVVLEVDVDELVEEEVLVLVEVLVDEEVLVEVVLVMVFPSCSYPLTFSMPPMRL